ncbi:hypothetical protein DY000_02009511 [Brassica cretica]|uniref:Transmembrane protein n=1 Tax=Brassica cretica TaxID=69181 RepID=A0ABQ7BTM2_BRACR|nr:hypothetical protein DY000_02009511 [Brassica cretica]
MEPKGNPNVPGDRKINKKTAASSATVKPNSKSPASSPIKTSNGHERYNRSTRQVASTLGYILQILFQTCAGAVLLTDGVFWFIIYPFLTSKEFNLDFFIVIKHSVNVVFLLGETFLNSLWFPLFRISYFVLWTGVFVILQWIVHACVSWYAAVGLMHVPCFGVFALIVKLKYMWFSKCFSEEP